MAGMEIACFLIGPNGAGKTTVGRMLASFLELQFIDSDLEMQTLHGRNIADLWEQEGANGFRMLENKVLEHCTLQKNIILATSASSIEDPENRKFFNTRGKVVYLAANPVNQYARSMLSARVHHLLANAPNKLTYLMKLTKNRDSLFNSIADFTVTTDNCSIEEIVTKIIDYLHCGVYC